MQYVRGFCGNRQTRNGRNSEGRMGVRLVEVEALRENIAHFAMLPLRAKQSPCSKYPGRNRWGSTKPSSPPWMRILPATSGESYRDLKNSMIASWSPLSVFQIADLHGWPRHGAAGPRREASGIRHRASIADASGRPIKVRCVFFSDCSRSPVGDIPTSSGRLYSEGSIREVRK